MQAHQAVHILVDVSLRHSTDVHQHTREQPLPGPRRALLHPLSRVRACSKPKGSAHLVRRVRVQPGCRLVQEQHARVGHQRDADVGPLALAAWIRGTVQLCTLTAETMYMPSLNQACGMHASRLRACRVS